MNTYCPLIKFTFAKKLTDRDSPKRSTYTSPTLKFLFKKLTYFIQPRTRSILTKLTYGMGPTSQELPNQLVLQTGHRNTLAKSVPWTPNATNVASGLAAQTCQFDRPCTNLAWCSYPGEPLCQRIHLISPHKNLQDSSQRYLLDQDPATTQTEGNFTPINQISICLCVCLSTCLAVWLSAVCVMTMYAWHMTYEFLRWSRSRWVG